MHFIMSRLSRSRIVFRGSDPDLDFFPGGGIRYFFMAGSGNAFFFNVESGSFLKAPKWIRIFPKGWIMDGSVYPNQITICKDWYFPLYKQRLGQSGVSPNHQNLKDIKEGKSGGKRGDIGQNVTLVSINSLNLSIQLACLRIVGKGLLYLFFLEYDTKLNKFCFPEEKYTIINLYVFFFLIQMISR